VSFLRDLDEKYVPELAARLERLVDRLPEPSGPAPLIVRLRRVDDRWTGRGPLALLRDVPQLGAVVIAALVFANAVTISRRVHPHHAAADSGPTSSASPDPGDPDDGHLGPMLGDKVPLYIRTATDHLLRTAAGSPDGQVVAVISTRSYRTPEQMAALLPGMEVLRVFFRAPLKLPNGEVHDVAVHDLVTDTRKAISRAGASRQAEADELLRVAATIQNDPAQKADQEKDAKIYQAEARLLHGGCDCVFAVVVRARLRVLADLLSSPNVRVIDAGSPSGGPGDYEFTALLPEEKITATGGNQA
jgi:hypothetical protein